MIRSLYALADTRLKRLLIAEIVLSTGVAILQGVGFLLLEPLLHAIFTGQYADAWRILGWLVAVSAVYLVCFGATTWVGTRASGAVTSSLLDTLGQLLVRLPLSWFSTERAGRMAALATQDIMFVSSVTYTLVRQAIIAFLTPATVLVGMYFFDWRLALAMTLVVPLIAVGYRVLRRAIARGDERHAVAVNEVSDRVMEFARVQPAVRMAADSSIADQMIDRALERQDQEYRGLLVTGGSAIALFSAIVQLALTVVLVLGALLAVGGSLDIATLIAVLVLVVRFNEPILAGGQIGGAFALGEAALKCFHDLQSEKLLPEPQTPGTPRDWGIEFRGVTFGYGAEPVLRNISFTAESGKMTAIVGPSGSGKTTITKLIARFYDPEAGEVLIGGESLPALGSDAVAAAVSPVFQDVFLFNDTILKNVWIGNLEADEKTVIEAATLARVDEIAERMPNGWSTVVGEGGSNLSGGERQRVSIARALAKDAPIVLLDEATSALDIGNEVAIGEVMDSIRADRTLVVVAHRLQTIMTADRIVMLNERGGIAESGSHDELLALDGAYARYWNERVGAVGWRLTAANKNTAEERTNRPETESAE